MHCTKASVLLIALWSLFILASFAVTLGFQVRQKMVLVKRLESRNTLMSIAEAAIPIGIAEVKKFMKAESFSLKDSWSNNLLFKDIPVGEGTCSFVRPPVEETCAFIRQFAEQAAPAEAVGYGLVDEESKINVNTADIQVLQALMRAVLCVDEIQAQALAASIIDWRDSDSALFIPVGSAEDSDYRNGKFPYEAKDALFEVMEEIRMVKGFDSITFERLRNYITIYGSGRVNVNTAGTAVLLAIGLPSAAVDKVLEFRAGKDGVAGTDDDAVFSNVADVMPVITENGGYSVAETAAMNNALNALGTVASTAFTVRAYATMPGNKDFAQVSCMFDLQGDILGYRRH